MAENEEVVLPPGYKKFIGLGLIALAIVIYGTWAIYFRVPWDIGLFSFTFPIFLFGVFFTWLFTAQEKKLRQEKREAAQRERLEKKRSRR